MNTDPDVPVGAKTPVGRLAVGLLVCLLPLVVSLFSPIRADTALVYVGVLPAFVALPLGRRVSIATAVSTSVGVLVGLLLSGSPALAAVFLAAAGVMVAWSYTRGWQAAATYVATQAALAAVAAPRAHLLGGGAYPAETLANAAVVSGLTLVAGLWVAGFGSLLLTGLGGDHEKHPWDRELIVFAATLAVLLGAATLAIMQITGGGNAWWILLTILVSLTPTSKGSVSRALQRAGGTVLGGAVAAMLVVLLPSNTVLTVVGGLAAIGSAIAFLKAPYWVFSALLTLALVLITFPVGRVLHGDVQRVGYTVLAAALVIFVALAVDRGVALVADRPSRRSSPS